jgi:hypothetical protein
MAARLSALRASHFLPPRRFFLFLFNVNILADELQCGIHTTFLRTVECINRKRILERE